jgi:hypothetical protein
MASNLTSYLGRQCTKVRRAVHENGANATAKADPNATVVPVAGNTATQVTQQHQQETSSKKSVYAPTTATPNPSAQIAAPIIIEATQAAQAPEVTAAAQAPQIQAVPEPAPVPAAEASSATVIPVIPISAEAQEQPNQQVCLVMF